MSRMPILPDAPPLLADANARYAKRRWTPLRVFAWTFLFASLGLWLAALPSVQAIEKHVGEAAKRRAPELERHMPQAMRATAQRLISPDQPSNPAPVTGE